MAAPGVSVRVARAGTDARTPFDAYDALQGSATLAAVVEETKLIFNQHFNTHSLSLLPTWLQLSWRQPLEGLPASAMVRSIEPGLAVSGRCTGPDAGLAGAANMLICHIS